jgi:hypothetical protein
MQAVAVSALQDQQIGPKRRLGRGQQRRPGRAQVAGKDQPLGHPALLVDKIALDIGRAEDMPGPLQPDAHLPLISIEQGAGVFIGQRDQPADHLQVVLHHIRPPGHRQAKGILQHQRGSSADGSEQMIGPVYPPPEARNPAMIEMHMGDHQRHIRHRKADMVLIRAQPDLAAVSALKQPQSIKDFLPSSN